MCFDMCKYITEESIMHEYIDCSKLKKISLQQLELDGRFQKTMMSVI